MQAEMNWINKTLFAQGISEGKKIRTHRLGNLRGEREKGLVKGKNSARGEKATLR